MYLLVLSVFVISCFTVESALVPLYNTGVCLYKQYNCGPCLCREDHRLMEKYFCDCQHLKPMKDCQQFYNIGYKVSGLYMITPSLSFGPYKQVFCDQTTDGGGWIVIQRRLDGSVNFYRDWKNYEQGFGAPQHEFWFGNYFLSRLTTSPWKLRVDMKYHTGGMRYAKYNTFKVGNAFSKYKSLIGGYSGNAGERMQYHSNRKFSTFDQDNDVWGTNCAESYKGGWWYGSCHRVNPNGRYYYYNEPYPYASGIHWDTYTKSLAFIEMKIRKT